jgi:hypothetical protein
MRQKLLIGIACILFYLLTSYKLKDPKSSFPLSIQRLVHYT